MAQIQIYGDTNKGCIFFDNSSVEPKFLGTIVASIKADETDRIVIQRTDRYMADGVTFRKLFRRLKATRVQNQNGENLINGLGYSVQQVVDYINTEASSYSAGGAVRPALDEHPNFALDATSTSIMVDNGESFGVNTIKAVLGADGLIDIVSSDHSSNSLTIYEDCPHANLQINGSYITGGPNDVVNKLNELFTVGAFEQVVISDPYATMVADVDGVDAGYTLEGVDAIDPIGDDIFTYDGSGYANYAGLKSTATIDQKGEYYTFDIRGEGTIGFGLVHTDASFDAGLASGNQNYADPDNFAAVNSAHYGYQFSHWFHATPNGSWTNYGAATGYAGGAGWSNNWDQQQDWLDGNPVKIRCGIDENGYIAISSLQNDGSWILHSRSNYPVAEGTSFHLGVKSQSTAARVYSAPKVHLLAPEAPTMYFRYIESGDGNFHYPLFATAAEANYYHKIIAGVETGESHQHVYPDDPTNTTWYMPTNGQMAGVNAPYNMVFDGQTVLFTEITSLTDADLAPSSYGTQALTVDELSAVNIQVAPQDVGYTTSVSSLPTGLAFNGSYLVSGTAPEVANDNVANPSDDYTITVTRTNSYGSSQGTLTLTVTNLTPPSSLPSGFTQVAGSFTDNGDGTYTVDNSSVVQVDLSLAEDKRIVIPASWAIGNVLPFLDYTQGESKAFFGIADLSPNWNDTPDLHSDFDAVVRWEATSASQHKHSMSVGDLIGANHNTVNSASLAYWNYAIEWDGTQLHVLRSATLSDLQTKHRSEITTGLIISDEPASSRSGSLPLVVATRAGGTMNLTTSGLSVIDIPAEPVTNLTPWTKALDFSGSSERAVQVSTSASVNPLRMSGVSTTVSAPAISGKTSSDSNSRPWATAIVFRSDKHNSNQHIWNMGEGAGSNDDNIYIRQSSFGSLHFGWGRDGALNECALGNVSTTTGWHGIYIAHTGERLSGSDATAANLADCFSIRRMGSEWSQPFGSLGSELSTSGNWVTNGGRMDRSITGDFTIGGRGSNRSFHGKVASMVITTLKLNDYMPTEAEIKMMITDPKKWEDDYRVGQYVRAGNSSSNVNYVPSSWTVHGASIMWLMGDGSMDSYSNMIRNDVYSSDQNYTKLNMISMVSNDIQNVTINGLS